MRKTTRVAKLSALALLTVCGAAAQAQTTVYKCVDKAGRVEFTDVSKPGCKALDLPGYFPTPVPAPRSTPAVTMRQGAGRPAASPATSPSSFPRVDTATQRARDDDRREILNEELRAEENKLAGLRRDFNNGEPERQGNEKNYAKYQERVARMRDDIGRAEKNIEALRREIANIR
jgi:HAMP domain-containing protein